MDLHEMGFGLNQPAWLAAMLLVPGIWAATRYCVTLGSRWRNGLSAAMCSLALLALVVALAEPQTIGPNQPPFAVFAIDASDSVQGAGSTAAEAFLRQALGATEAGPYAVVYFGASAQRASQWQPDVTVDRQATDLAAALELASVLPPPEVRPHVVLLTDGVATSGDTRRAAEAAKAAGLPISTVPLVSCEPEVYVCGLRIPEDLRAAEPCDVEVVLYATGANRGTVELISGAEEFIRTTEPSSAQEVHTDRGSQSVRLRFLFNKPGSRTLTARATGFSDTLAGNNTASVAVEVKRRRAVLLVEHRAGAGGPLAAALRGAGWAVEVGSSHQVPHSPDPLESFDAVVLVNTPSAALAPGQMQALADYVRRGGGLVVVGGDQAFTAGGYRGTILEELLPVESEPARKHPRPPLALLLVVDRSQSMQQADALGLAKEAMRRTVRMLRPEDHLGVLAFDESSRWVVPIEPLRNPVKVLAQIDQMTAGGRTDMGPAIEKAYLALHEVFAPSKHMIVLSDGVSHPADFHGLAERIARSGITLSTVALGREASRGLLEDLARIGKGRFYACDDPRAVPQVFVGELAQATQLGIHEGPLSVSERKQGTLVRDTELTGAPPLLGYVETRPKKLAHVPCTTPQGDPLWAWWPFGKGVVVGFTSDAEHRWAAAWLSWPGFNRFWVGLVRHAMQCGPTKGPGHGPNREMLPDFPAEWRVQPTDRALLRWIADRTGGMFDPEPQAVWRACKSESPGHKGLWPWLVALAAVLEVVDIAVRRWP